MKTVMIVLLTVIVSSLIRNIVEKDRAYEEAVGWGCYGYSRGRQDAAQECSGIEAAYKNEDDFRVYLEDKKSRILKNSRGFESIIRRFKK